MIAVIAVILPAEIVIVSSEMTVAVGLAVGTEE